ncbi:MAG: type II toxin-antitoxin system PemK/MazF family toxin [Verrucomicrobiaceae bacterium]|nr:type II toxin-antitoxin system PemK/MazF family toxin [Verrucomicrobiaceae bacterium]
MRQWEIYLFPFERERPHPAVILSNDERCLNDGLEYVNALICTSAKLNREPKKNEVLLNSADGLDWKTAVRCDVIYLLAKADFRERRGKVTPQRRVAIGRKIAETLRLQLG